MKLIVPYTCYRCGYETRQRGHMVKHFNLLKPCPGHVNAVFLTDEIKESIMQNRIYKPPPPPPPPPPPLISNTTIYNHNNINTIMSLITKNFSDTDRLSTYVQYKNKEIISLCDDIEHKFKDDALKLRNNHYRYSFELNHDSLLDVFDKTTSCKDPDFSDLNIIYNSKDNKVNILDDTNEWIEYIFERGGIQAIIEGVQDGYLHEYERYIINAYLSSDGQSRQQNKEKLCEYYQFLGSFNVYPLASEKNKSTSDGFVTQSIIDEFYPLYKSVKDAIKERNRNLLRRDLMSIIKRNSENKLRSLYNKFIELFHMDETFKDTVNEKSIEN